MQCLFRKVCKKYSIRDLWLFRYSKMSDYSSICANQSICIGSQKVKSNEQLQPSHGKRSNNRLFNATVTNLTSETSSTNTEINSTEMFCKQMSLPSSKTAVCDEILNVEQLSASPSMPCLIERENNNLEVKMTVNEESKSSLFVFKKILNHDTIVTDRLVKNGNYSENGLNQCTTEEDVQSKNDIQEMSFSQSRDAANDLMTVPVQSPAGQVVCIINYSQPLVEEDITCSTISSKKSNKKGTSCKNVAATNQPQSNITLKHSPPEVGGSGRLTKGKSVSNKVRTSKSSTIEKKATNSPVLTNKITETALNSNCSPKSSVPLLVYFDLETTGLSYSHEICQISCICPSLVDMKRETETASEFNVYTLPERSFQAMASKITGITRRKKSLYLRGVAVPTVSLQEGILSLIEWLDSLPQPPVLVGHNSKTFDAPRLVMALWNNDMLHRFQAGVAGFADSLPMVRSLCPGRGNYKLESLVEEHCARDSIQCHNALDDCRALYNVLCQLQYHHEQDMFALMDEQCKQLHLQTEEGNSCNAGAAAIINGPVVSPDTNPTLVSVNNVVTIGSDGNKNTLLPMSSVRPYAENLAFEFYGSVFTVESVLGSLKTGSASSKLLKSS